MRRSLTALMLTCILGAAQAAFAGSGVIGHIQFTMGDVLVYAAGGDQAHQAQTNHPLHAGDRLVTGPSSRAMLKMSDQGLISIHPDSSITLRSYRHDPAHPEANDIQLHLDKGSVRSITGQAGQANKDSYRLTTPLIAIGIRGTDYIAYTNEDISRAALISGAIAVHPLRDECQQAPALCPNAVLLDESVNALMVEYDQRIQTMQFVPILPEIQAQRTQPADTIARDISPAINEKLSPDPAQMLAKLRENDVATPSMSAPAPAAFTLASANTPQNDGARELVLSDLQQGRIWLDKAAASPLPAQGSASLALRDIQLTDSTGLLPAQATQASLNLDFDARSFDTRLTFTSAALPSGASLHSSGYLRGDGRFFSRSGDDVVGLTAAEGQAAAYIFNLYKQGIPVTGMTSWQK